MIKSFTLPSRFMYLALLFFCFANQNLFSQSLDDLANEYGTDKGSNCGSSHHYTRHYEKLLGHLKNSKIKLLEIGTWKGYSLRMWVDYFPNAMIYSIDKNPLSAYVDAFDDTIDLYPIDFSHERVQYFVGNQSDPIFLNSVCSAIQGDLDVIIDDGSHKSYDQQMSFAKLFKKVKPGGLYIIENLNHHPQPNLKILEMQDILIDFVNNEIDQIDFSSYLDQVSVADIKAAFNDIKNIQWFDSAFRAHGEMSFAVIRKKGA
ncbi:MAG TPA: class I SAM-dependent methyltransferase [Chlamydiales bacterium]|nr:class I SAM-dependent methyltransferase [Chlamydiales bacterium]